MIDRVQAFYGFTRVPFGRDLAPSMLHRHFAHSEAVARITWCINNKALGVITGEVGAGKTVALRAAIADLAPARHTVIYLPNPAVGMRGLHEAVVSSLGGTPRYHLSTLTTQCVDSLIAEGAERGRTPVIVIDESHLLQHAELDAVRMLTNCEMDSSTPFALLLIGQPTLRKKMKLGILAALDQRVSIRYQMPPMTEEETAGYLQHHLTLARRSDTLFSDDAVHMIHTSGRGLPRGVNTSPSRPSSPRSPRRRPSSTSPPPAWPSPSSSRQTDHEADIMHTKTPAACGRRGHFTPAHLHRQRRPHPHPERRATSVMPQARREKKDHLIYADVVDSKSKAGVWMGERASFQEKQGRIIEGLKEKTDWVGLRDAIMVISTDPAGITVIVPNPTLPGMIVLADGGSPATSAKLQAAAEEKVRAIMGELGIVEEETAA